MTKLERQFLDCCNENFSERSLIGNEDIQRYISVSPLMLSKCAERLNENGYIKNLHRFKFHAFNFQTTYKDLNYKKFKIEQLKNFLLRSVFTPVAVSVATTLITLWLKSLL